MSVSMTNIKQLRELTQVSYKDCKKALEETQGDVEAAARVLWSTGIAKAQAKSNRVTTEGLVASLNNKNHTLSVLVEVNCQTDFVAKNDNFIQIAQSLAQQALELQTEDIATVSQADCAFIQDAKNLEEKRQMLLVQLGENIQFNRIILLKSDSNARVTAYCHRGRIASAISINTTNIDVAEQLAMHIIACTPRFITSDQIDEDQRSHMREICLLQRNHETTEEDIARKLKQSLREICLLDQRLFQDSSLTVKDYLAQHHTEVTAFKRIEVGCELIASTRSSTDSSR